MMSDESCGRDASLSTGGETDPPPPLGAGRPGETSGERRIRLLRTVLGDLREEAGE
jgi:hypothetical protein